MQSRLLSRVRAVNIWLMAPLLGLAVFLGVFASVSAPVAQAATSSNLNFQARLLTSSGAVVPDGTYNIDFKLYNADSTTGSVGACSGACVWEETRTGGNKVTVINGYYSVNLGSVTPFGSSINWDQQLWLTMNIGGTGASPSWDGEMQNAGHSIALTALPYAFTAGQLTSGTGASRGTLSFASLGQATAITLPDPGAGTATVCYQSATACGFVPGTAANYIQNGTGVQSNANFNIQSATVGSIGGIINAASGQTADIFELKNSSIVFSVGNNGQVLSKATTGNDSTTFFQIQPSGSSTPLFDADTVNMRIGIGSVPSAAATAATFQVAGTGSVQQTATAGTMTASGNEISDSTRTANTQGDGRAAPDSSFGVWEGTTNLITNGGFESNTTGWTGNLGTETLSRDTSKFKFGTAGLKTVIPGSGLNEGDSSPSTSAGSAASGQTWTASAWVNAPAGSTLAIQMIERDASNAFLTSGSTAFAGTGNWQKVSYTRSLTNASTSRLNMKIITTTSAQAITFWTDGVQLEQKSIATPYVETNGATASRNAGRVQAPSLPTKLNATQGWVAMRVRMGTPSSAGATLNSGNNNPLFFWSDGTTNNYIWMNWQGSATPGISMNGNGSGGTGSSTTVAQTWNAGDTMTVIGYWTGSQWGISRDGANFTTGARSGTFNTSTLNTFDIGSLTNSRWGDLDVLWFASGTGTLTNADAAAISARANADPDTTFFNATDSSSVPTMVWKANSANYQDKLTFSVQNSTAAGILNIDAADSSVLLPNATSSASAIVLGGDANLYRSAAQTLKTDFNLTAGGNLTINGSSLFQNTADSTTAFQIQNASGTSNLLVADTVNSRVGIGTNAPGAALDVKGATSNSTAYSLIVQNSSSSQYFTIRNDGVISANQNINYAGGFGPRSGSSGAALTFATGGSSSGDVTLDTSASNGTGKNIHLKSGGSTYIENSSGTAVVSVTNSGDALFKGSDSATAFQVQSSSSTLLSVNTLSSIVTINPSTVNIGSDNAVHTIHIGDGAGSGTFPISPVLDNFNRANGGMGSNWSTVSGFSNYNILSNVAHDQFGTFAYMYWNPAGFGPNAEAYATLASTGADNVRVLARFDAVNNNGYAVQANPSTGTWSILKLVSGSSSVIGSTFTQSFSVGNKIGIRVVGSTIEAWYNNGSSWTKLASQTDSTYSGAGNIAMESKASDLDDFGGGTASVTASQGVTIGSTNSSSNLLLQAGTGNITLSSSGSTIVKPSNDGTTAFQVQNASGSQQVMAVDTFNNQLVLGTAGGSGLNGKLVFSTTNASNTTITIQAASTATSYSLTLPTAGPALGQCLQNDGTTVGQLTFGACGASGTFVNFAPSSVQADSSTNNSIFINKTGASGNILELQKSASDVFKVANNGDITATGLYNGNTFTAASLVFSGASAASLQAASSQALNITGNASSLWQVGGTNQNLTIQTSGTGTLALDTAGLGTVSLGAANAGTINIGSNNSTAISIGGTSLTGTVTNKVQGLTTTLTGAASNSSYVVKSTSNSNGTFQVQNSGGNKVFSVDTTAGQTVLGQSSSVNGSILFQNSGNSNGITLNSTGANASYTLTLPAQAPSGGLCIQTSTGNASQLVFASCANNNTSISQVAYWDTNNATTKTISPSAVGDEIVLTTQIPSTGVTVSGISGGGVTNWSKVVTSAGNGTVNRVEMWVGTVSSLGSSLVTVTYAGGSPGSNEITLTEFTAAGVNQSTSWGVESFNSQLNSTASGTVTYPSLTAVNGAELYVGYAQAQNPPVTSGGTTGFNYQQTSTQHNMVVYNPSLTANTNYQPTALQSPNGQSNTVAAILTAFVTSTAINNSTSLQKANFYVQAANAGSVAGVLQAASSGSADILNLRNSGGANVMTVSSTGDVAIKSTGSTTAFQVQNNSNYNVMSVDTTGNQVVLGDATHLSGKITFNDSGDSNSISIVAPATVPASYTLTLPNNTPSAGLCLGTSPSNANQLIFTSCATQIATAAISHVNSWSNNGTSITTLSISPASVGNLMVLFSHATNNVTITGLSGAGISWTKVNGNTNTTGQGNNEMWRGVVTASGAATITVTYSAAAGVNEIAAEEFSMGSSNGTWAIDVSSTLINVGSQTTINYPSLTPQNTGELYVGYGWSQNTMSSTPNTSGYTYVTTSGSKRIVYNTNVTGGVATQPQASQSTAGNYNTVAGTIVAYVGTSVIVNSTSTQQANFNVQAAASGTVAGVLQGAASGSADVLQVKDGSGINVMTVNTTTAFGGSGVTLGTSNSVGGQLIFNSSGNSNQISIQAPTAPGASYYLTLPTTTPAPGQCLATSPSNANQLVFSSCANQVTSVAISFVNNWSASVVSNSPTLAVSPAAVGNLMTLFFYTTKSGSITSVSGGGVSAWSKVVAANSEEMWRGQVTSTGSSTITVNVSGAANPTNELAVQEWTTGSNNGSWVIDTSGTISNSSSTTVTYPNLTPQSTKDLYIGYAHGGSTMSAGSTPGYSYFSGAGSAFYGAYNTTVSAGTQPTASQSSSNTSIAAAALIAAYSSSSVIANSTNTQQANFNIQAATPGTVAGTLQAFFTGTGDIMDLLDGSGNLTDSFDYQGNLLVRPSTAGATAFQVQNTSNANVLSVDTSAKRVVIGAGTAGDSLANITLLVLDSETGTTSDPTAVDGAMYYNATNRVFRCAVDGIWQNCSGMLYANTSKSTVVSNCSNNCAAFDTTASIPVNYCLAGRVIKLSAEGVFSSTGSPNLQFGVYYGGDPSVAANDVLLGTLSPAAAVTSAANNYFKVDFNVTCFSPTSMQAGGVLNLQVGTAASGLTTLPINAAAAATVTNGPTAKNLYIFPIWSAASLSNTAQITQFTVTAP